MTGASRPWQVVHLSTVHPRHDIRIHVKEAQTLHRALGSGVAVMVADGKGDEREPGRLAVIDLGRLNPHSRLARALVGNWRALLRNLRLRPAVVHLHDPELLLAGFVLRAAGLKVVYDVHEDVPRQILSKAWIPGALRRTVAGVVRTLEALAARSFSAIVPATPSIAARFPAGKTALVQNFPIEAELAAVDAAEYRTRPAMFAYVGAISAIRGAQEMVRALGDAQLTVDARMEWAGGLSDTVLLQALRAEPGWTRVTAHGALGRAAVAQLLARARAGLVLFHPLPNHVHAQPNKLFEYMSAGLPVIASDFPLWREIVAGADCGLLVDPMDPRAIAGAMRWILQNPEAAEAMGRRGQEAVRLRYNWDREARGLRELYARLLVRPELRSS